MAKIKVYRDPNVDSMTYKYRNGSIRYTFDLNKAEFEIEEEHAIHVVRDCPDLFRSKRKSAAKKKSKA